MTTFLRKLLKNQARLCEGLLPVLVLIATTSMLSAIPQLQYGSAISLRTLTGENYLTMIPGAADAGTTSTTQSEENNSVFQILTADGASSGGNINYGDLVSIQLPTNNLWITLNPATNFGDIAAMPHVRNNAPQPLEWEQFFFIYSSGTSSTTMNFNDHVYLARVDQLGNHTYLKLDSNTHIASTVTSIDDATVMLITYGGSLSPYTPPTPIGPALHYRDPFIITCGPDFSLNFNVHSAADNAGYLVDLNGTNTLFTTTQIVDYMNIDQIVYGAPLFFGPAYGDVGPMTMNPAPGRIRTNATMPGVWEEMYFISVNGRNGDLMYYGDQFYVARNGLISGNFVTEYITVDWTNPTMGMITTTTDFAQATALTPTL